MIDLSRATLVTIDGPDFSGKSEVATPGLESVLRTAGIPVLKSREPGGKDNPAAEEIRAEILQRSREGTLTSHDAIELFNRARAIHLEHTVMPFFQEEPEGIAILDRYVDSTLVYQCLATDDPVDLYRAFELHNQYTSPHTSKPFPDLTYIMHFNPHEYEGIAQFRSSHAQRDLTETSHWDSEGFRRKLLKQEAYVSLPDLFADIGIPREFRMIDAGQSGSVIVHQIAQKLRFHLGERGLHTDKEIMQAYEHLWELGQWQEIDEKWTAEREYVRRTQEGRLPPQARR